MSTIELRQPLWMETPLGLAEARFLKTDAVEEVAALWGVFQCDTKENWWWPNSQVRLCESASSQRDAVRSPIKLSEAEIATLSPHIKRHTSSQFFWRVDDRKPQQEGPDA